LSDDKQPPPINVKMGSNNTVGQIGHNYYQAPPPPPNTVWQSGEAVGLYIGEPLTDGGVRFQFPMIASSARPLDLSQPFEAMGRMFQIDNVAGITTSNMPGREFTAQHVLCHVLN
jgi:hypothetical protein